MRTTIAWGMFIVMVGCGGGGNSTQTIEIRTTQNNVCAEVAEVACFNMYQCCSEGEIERFLLVTDPRTEEQCRDDVRTRCERHLAVLDYSIKNNHVRFDSNIMDTCLKALVAPSGTCATVSSMKPWTEACMDSAWVGIVANGGECDFPYECVKDSFCSPNRVCTALPTDGMPCSLQGCASGLFCDFGTCRPFVAANGTCTSTVQVQCQKGLFCDTTAATKTCTALHKVGEPCTGDDSCESNTCLPGHCAGTQTNCFTDANCSRCESNNSFCTTDSSCGLGTCHGTTTTCTSKQNCSAPATCDFPTKCLPYQCMGPVVCAESHITVDYCQDAFSALPLH